MLDTLGKTIKSQKTVDVRTYVYNRQLFLKSINYITDLELGLEPKNNDQYELTKKYICSELLFLYMI